MSNHKNIHKPSEIIEKKLNCSQVVSFNKDHGERDFSMVINGLLKAAHDEIMGGVVFCGPSTCDDCK